MTHSKVGVNVFVLRQTADSKFSHFDGSFEQVAEMTDFWFEQQGKPGYRDGVMLVRVPASGFFCGVVEVTT